MSKLLKINKVRSFFQRRKQILVDSCCDTETACCAPGTGLRGYKIYYKDSIDNIEIDNGDIFNITINTGNKWNIILDTISNDVNIFSITVTPIILDLNITTTPFTATYPGGSAIANANWSTTGTRLFTVDITTDSGNISFTAQIKVI